MESIGIILRKIIPIDSILWECRGRLSSACRFFSSVSANRARFRSMGNSDLKRFKHELTEKGKIQSYN